MERIITTTYSKDDFEKGVCESCGKETEFILIGTNECVDCIEDEKFYEETMKYYEETMKGLDESY